MSYEIVRSVKIDKKNNKVFITGASNNVTPKTYTKWNCSTISHILETKGEVAAIKEILEAYWDGQFQPGGINYYSKSMSLVDRNKYNWDNRCLRVIFTYVIRMTSD